MPEHDSDYLPWFLGPKAEHAEVFLKRPERA